MDDHSDYEELKVRGMRLLMKRGHSREDAEEIANDAYGRAIKKYDSEKGEFPKYYMIWVWGLGCNSTKRKCKLIEGTVRYVDHAKRELWKRPHPDRAIIVNEEYCMLVSHLKGRELRIVDLYYKQGMSYREIGRKEKISRQRARQIVIRAIKKIKRELWKKEVRV